MIIVPDLEQRTDAWHDFRAAGIGGPEIASVLGLSEYQTPLQLYLEKMGITEPKNLDRNPHVRRGICFEEHIANIVLRHFGQNGTPLCGIHEEYSFLRASFDLVTDSHYYEIEAPSDTQWNWMLKNGAHPWYMAQARYQGIVAERLGLKGKLVYWRQVEESDGTIREEVRIFDVVVDEDQRQTIIEAAQLFWGFVQSGILPPADPERDVLTEFEMTPETRERWHIVTARAKERMLRISKAKELVDRLKEAGKATSAKLRSVMGEYTSAFCSNVRLSLYERKASISYVDALAEIAPDIGEHAFTPFRRIGSWQTRLTLDKTSGPDEADDYDEDDDASDIKPPSNPEGGEVLEAEMTPEMFSAWMEAAPRLKKLEARKKRVNRYIKEKKAELEADKEIIVSLIGDRCSVYGSGIRFTRYWKVGPVDYSKAVAKLLPHVSSDQLEMFRGAPKWCERLTVSKPKALKAPKGSSGVAAIARAA